MRVGKDEKCCINCAILQDREGRCEECRFEHKDHPSLFYRITRSPELLARSSVYCLSSDLCRTDDGKFTVKRNWKSPFIDRCYDTEEEAIAATVAKLKECSDGTQLL